MAFVPPMLINGPLDALTSRRVLTPEGWCSATIDISGEMISTVRTADSGPTNDGVELPDGLSVIPGLIDLQVNGGWGIDLAQTPERFDDLAKLLPAVGVTAWLPTLVTSGPEKRERALAALAAETRDGGAVPLGWHFEGPWLSPEKAGAHRLEFLEAPPADRPVGYTRAGGLAMVTLAPELPGALTLCRQLADAGVIVSCGHSAADAETTTAARTAGATMGTHLFNAMSGLHHREPGVAAALLLSDAYVGIIVDRLHVHDDMVRLAWRLAPDRLVLVSDAMAGLGLPSGTTELAGSRVRLDGVSARLADGTLAGSVISLRDAVEHLRTVTGCDAATAIRAASDLPARVMNDDRRGTIVAGKRADLVVVDDDFAVVATIIGGDVVFVAPKSPV